MDPSQDPPPQRQPVPVLALLTGAIAGFAIGWLAVNGLLESGIWDLHGFVWPGLTSASPWPDFRVWGLFVFTTLSGAGIAVWCSRRFGRSSR